MRASPLLLLALAGCSPTAMQPGAPEAFAAEVAGRTAGAPSSCVSTFANQNLRVVNPQMVAYGHGRTIYINRLRAACPALSQFNSIIVETQGGQYCRGDHIRALEPGAIIPGPTCFLGDWTEYRRP